MYNKSRWVFISFLVFLPVLATAALYGYEGMVTVYSTGGTEEAISPSPCACDDLGTAIIWGQQSNMLELHWATCAEYNDAGVRVWTSAAMMVDGTYPPGHTPHFVGYGLLLYPAKPIATFDFWVDGYPAYSYLFFGTTQRLTATTGGEFKYLAAAPNTDYYYCYRFYDNAFRVCKMQALDVLSYFTPAHAVDAMTCDAAGTIYIGAKTARTIYKYTEGGALLTSWSVPDYVTDLSRDGQDRILAVCPGYSDSYAYVYANAGVLLDTLIIPGVNPMDGPTGADVAPSGKYYVHTPESYMNYGHIFRYAPDPTTIHPASLGRIKAAYK